MKYDLSNKYKAQIAREYFEKLISKGAFIELREVKMKRNLSQNALYWIWLQCIEVETGTDKNELHFMYRALFIPREESYITEIIKPELYTKIKPRIDNFHYFEGLELVIDVISFSTTNLDESQFALYLTNIKKHAKVNHGVTLLNQDEKNFEDFYKHYNFR